MLIDYYGDERFHLQSKTIDEYTYVLMITEIEQFDKMKL